MEKKNPSGFIYFLQIANGGAIKIGFTRGNPSHRAKCLQSVSPHDLVCLGFFPASFKEERKIHKLFPDAFIRSEWFHPIKDLLEYIAERCGHINFDSAIKDLFHTDLAAETVSLLPRYDEPRRKSFEKLLNKHSIDSFIFHKWLAQGRLLDEATMSRVKRMINEYRAYLVKQDNAPKNSNKKRENS